MQYKYVTYMGDCMCNDYDLRHFEWYKAIEGMKYISFMYCSFSRNTRNKTQIQISNLYRSVDNLLDKDICIGL